VVAAKREKVTLICGKKKLGTDGPTKMVSAPF
jgi:hypothetical protein